jgi:hypothetical protein
MTGWLPCGRWCWPGCSCGPGPIRRSASLLRRGCCRASCRGVDQLAGPLALVAADAGAAALVQAGERRAAVPGQHGVHGGGMHAQPRGDPRRAEPLADPQPDDPPLGPRRGTARAGVRPRRPVRHPGPVRLPAAACPAGGRGVRDLEPLRCSAQRPAVVDGDRARRSRPVSVSGALRWATRASWVLGVDVVIHTEPGGSPSFQDHQPVSLSPTSMGRTPSRRCFPSSCTAR